MAHEYSVNQTDLIAVADAIRTKGETSGQLVFPSGFVNAIQEISTGAGLNYSVRAYDSEDSLPETAAENTIAVITEVAITSHAFATEQPISPVEGMVWIETGNESDFEFAATIENPICVYPVKVKQYNNGVWADKTTLIYQSGSWSKWVTDKVIFESGKGEVIDCKTKVNSAGDATISIATNEISFSYTSENNSDVVLYSSAKIDVSDMNTLELTGVFSTLVYPEDDFTGFGLISSVPSYDGYGSLNWAAGKEIASKSTTSKTYTVDVSNLSGSYYFAFVASVTKGKITDIRLKQ